MGLAAVSPRGGQVNTPDRVVRGARVLVDGALRPAAVHLRAGRISAVTAPDETAGAADVVEAGDLVVFPGLVDAHVHVNEPGRTEWEGYASATAAALAGGVTTLVDMPLNGLPPLLDAAALRARLAAIAATARADVALWAGLVSADTSQLAGLAALGVAGVKCFMSPSGVDEFPNVGEAELDAALPVLRDLGLPLLVHAESPAALAGAAAMLPPGADPRAHATWLATRPAAAEAEAIDLLVRLCRRHRAAVHVVHVSSSDGCERIAAARAEGLPMTAESCPHYLTFAAADVPDGATAFKCAPPLREGAHREALWSALAAGTLDLVASDHSPSPAVLKSTDSGDFMRAWGGIAGLQLLLPATWTGAAARGHGPDRLGAWLAEAPARLAGLSSRKGRLAPGCDADVVLWDPEGSFEVRPEALQHRHRLTPWAGRTLRGTVVQVFLRGRLVYHRDRGFTDPPGGVFLPVRRGARGPGPN
jgi:allantoinase